MSTSPALSAPNLLKLVRANKLADPERVDAVLKTLPADAADAPDSRLVADALVAAGLLTRFQSNLLLQGKSRSLTIAGKYRLIDRLGAGGMGLVYLCEHLKMRRTVAVKVLPQKQATEPGQLDRFLREAQAAAAMKHPNIVQAYDIDQDNGVHYLVMEFIDGADLDRLVSAIGPLDAYRAAFYIAQAALGLQHAAERGLVHRDIKPSNLLVDREGIVKVLDLGLARLVDRASGLTERFDANAVIGTADYIAPEQALNSHDVDVRADIYALGCTFYFLLAGHAPFRDANVTQKLLMHQMREPPPITDLRPDVPFEMADVLARMMAKDPEQRYQSPAEVVEDLSPWTDPPPPPPTEAEIPPRSFGNASPSGSSVHGRSQATAALPRAGQRAGVTEALTMRRRGSETGTLAKGKTRWPLYAAAGTLGFVVLVVAAWRPWSSPSPDDDRTTAADPKGQGTWPATGASKTLPLRPGRGFSFLFLEAGANKQHVVNEEVRELPTDVLYVTGNQITRAVREEPELAAVCRRDAAGGVLPYAVTSVGQGYPHTLFAVEKDGALRTLEPADFLPPEQLGGARPDHHLLVKGPTVLTGGRFEIAALVGGLSDVAAGPGGTTIKLNSGALILAGAPGDRDTSLGAGVEPLTLDFAGRPGYLTVSSDKDFARPKAPTREFRIRARLTGFGTAPLVLSGLWGNVVALHHLENDFPALHVQGLVMGGTQAADKVFRVTFTDDRQLGRPLAPITLSDATLAYQGDGPMDVDRTLTLQAGKSGRLTSTERAKGPRGILRWVGRVTGGGKFIKGGNATVVLANGANDLWGGTEVAAGTLSLQAEGGTPTGSGPVTVNSGGTLTGTGRVVGAIAIRPGGTLQPGADGKALRVTGLSFQRGKDASHPNFAVRLSSSSGRHLAYEGTGSLDLAGAALKVTTTAGFQPTGESFVTLIDNTRAPAVRGTFQNLEAGARLVTTDGKWTARVSYQGDAKIGVPSGGKDVVLYDWAPVKK